MPRILLVDQDDAESEEIRRALGLHGGWDVVRAATVLDAIRVAGEAQFDAAVLDCELPDGSGLDLLDFLRIGSPGIRIVVLSRGGTEAQAFQALSHGAADWLVKDRHLVMELPRRVDALLDPLDPRAAVVEALTPLEREEASGVVEDDAPDLAERLAPLLRDLVGGPVFAAAVFDERGRPVAARLVPPLDADGVGFGLATLHHQVAALWGHANLRPTSYLALVQVDGGVLALTAVPGPYLVALLLAGETPPEKALRLLLGAAGCIATVASASNE